MSFADLYKNNWELFAEWGGQYYVALGGLRAFESSGILFCASEGELWWSWILILINL